MAAYNYKIIDFLATRNTVVVRDENEFDSFRNILIRFHIVDILTYQTFEEWQVFATINHRNPNVFCFEYDNAKGLTWYDNVHSSRNWYGVAPITVRELISDGQWVHDL